MSKITSLDLRCPGCGEDVNIASFHSLNAARVPAQVERILDGTFAHTTCEHCGREWGPEHEMLYSDWSRQLWIITYPSKDRSHFEHLEGEVAERMDRELAMIPKMMKGQMDNPRVFLAFGWNRLAEIIRIDRAGLDKGLVECAKLRAAAEHRQALADVGPTELLVEKATGDGTLELGVYRLAGPRIGALSVASGLLHELAEKRTILAANYPELFSKPFADATRYPVPQTTASPAVP